MLKDDLTALLNRYNAENASDTPDWILALYLMDCLKAYDNALKARTRWYTDNNEESFTRLKEL